MIVQAVSGGICESISPSTVRRWLSEDALKPWQFQSWIFITDPNFEPKAQRVLDLYQRIWDGKPLGRRGYVVSSGEKTSVQARCRCHPTLPTGKSRMMRVNHDYHRRGAVAYLAAYDVHRAKVHGRCEDTTGIVPFAALVEQVMTQEPYKSADRVFWVVDNGSSHRGQAAIDRLGPLVTLTSEDPDATRRPPTTWHAVFGCVLELHAYGFETTYGRLVTRERMAVLCRGSND